MAPIEFKDFIKDLTHEFVPVVSNVFGKDDYIAIDLSHTNTELSQIDTSSAKSFELFIKQYLKKNNRKLAYGGYREKRSLYKRSTHFNTKDKDLERNIHLGLDIWCDAGTEVIAPLDGKIHSFNNNTNYGDYGPTIIVEHTLHTVTFYTLYGHLSRQSIQYIEKGDKVYKGQSIATLGDASVNGEYAPHLHFQIIKDLQGNSGDYPGVSNLKTIDHYVKNCPDPNLLLKMY